METVDAVVSFVFGHLGLFHFIAAQNCSLAV